VKFNFDGGANAVQHRALRRARPYGPPYVQPDQADRGLVGYFIGANLPDQFSFLMQTWITGSNFANYDFSPDSSGYDPLFGAPPTSFASGPFEYCADNADPRNPANYAVVPAASPNVMPQLVVTKGSLYVFFPSITALGLMANGTISS